MAKGKPAAPSTRDEEIAALYEGDFQGFTARRNDLAKRLKKEGAAEGAEAVRRLSKPSAAAWALNQVSHREPARRDALLEAGAALRETQEKLVAGKADLAAARAAVQAEREVVGELVEVAGRLAEEAGAPLSPAAAERARETLHAVALDEEVRAQFEQGRLAGDHQAVGLGPLPTGAPPPRAKADRSAGRAEKRRREELETAEAEERDARRRLDAAERELDRARRRADHAQQELAAASAALEEAEDTAEAATGRLEQLRKRAG